MDRHRRGAATTANKQICLANIHHSSYFALSQIARAAQGLNIGKNEIRARNGSVESYLAAVDPSNR
jgi:hypothetical protein